MLEVDGGIQAPNLDLNLPDVDPVGSPREPDRGVNTAHSMSPDSGEHWAAEGAWEVTGASTGSRCRCPWTG